MNRTIQVSVFCALALAFAAGVSAATLTGDTFSYTGPLTSNGWTAHSGGGNKVIMADGNVATLDQSAGSGEDVNLAFAAQGATDTTYASMLVTVLSGGGDPVGGNGGTTPVLDADGLYFTHFKDDGFGFRARTFVAAPGDGGDFTFGLGADDSSVDETFANDFLYDTQYKLVYSYDAATGAAKLWVDPVDESSLSITDATGSVGTLVESVGLRQSNDYTGLIEIDNVGVGTNFMDSMIVPEPAAIVLLGTLALGVIAMRKRLG